MINTIEFKKTLLDAGMTQRDLSNKSGISKNALNRKINNKADVTGTEINIICDCLGITDPLRKCEIFLFNSPRSGTQKRGVQ